AGRNHDGHGHAGQQRRIADRAGGIRCDRRDSGLGLGRRMGRAARAPCTRPGPDAGPPFNKREMTMDMKSNRHLQRLAVIYGSDRDGRLCDRVGRWALDRVAAHGEYQVDLVDPKSMRLPQRLGSEAGRSLSTFRSRIGQADAFLIVTPEYNHGYPSVLKLLIDSANEEWK